MTSTCATWGRNWTAHSTEMAEASGQTEKLAPVVRRPATCRCCGPTHVRVPVTARPARQPVPT